MQLSSRTEWIVVGALVVYMAFFPSLPVVRDILSNPIGKVLGLSAVVYVWKYVSHLLALLLALAVYRAGGVREGADDASMKPKIMCEAGKRYDETKKACVDEMPPPPPPPMPSGMGSSMPAGTPPPPMA